jgi:hypothetical protein
VKADGNATKWPKITTHNTREDIPFRTRIFDLLYDCENTKAYIRTKPKTRAPNDWVRGFVENVFDVLSSVTLSADPQVLDSLVRFQNLLDQVVENTSRVVDRLGRLEGQSTASGSSDYATDGEVLFPESSFGICSVPGSNLNGNLHASPTYRETKRA